MTPFLNRRVRLVPSLENSQSSANMPARLRKSEVTMFGVPWTGTFCQVSGVL